MLNDFLSLQDCSTDDLNALLDRTERLREAFRAGSLPQALQSKAVALLWDDVGFRNRVAFELGIVAMGGVAVQVPGRLGEREPVADVVAYLDNWFDALVVRTPEYATLQLCAATVQAPVINARTSHNHPCEVLGDLAFLRAQRGSLEGLRVAFIGEATNLCHSWCEAAARLPIRVTQACPPGYTIAADYLGKLRADAVGEIYLTDDLEAALQGAEVIYTDCWPRSPHEGERQAIARLFLPYQITPQHFTGAAPNVFFLPCPPVHRGEEVSAEAMVAPQCRVYEAKDYLLHAQNAVLLTVLDSDQLP